MPDPRPPERVANYPRPPRLEREPRRVRILLGGETVAETDAAWRVLETHHPPAIYLPPAAFALGALRPATGSSACEWKGRAAYWTIAGGSGRVEERAGWSYPDPTPAFAPIRDHVAVYAGRMDACFLGEELVAPQPGGFYGGWITPELVGPFKGGPGTARW